MRHRRRARRLPPISRLVVHIIKTERGLQIAEALLALVQRAVYS